MRLFSERVPRPTKEATRHFGPSSPSPYSQLSTLRNRVRGQANDGRALSHESPSKHGTNRVKLRQKLSADNSGSTGQSIYTLHSSQLTTLGRRIPEVHTTQQFQASTQPVE